MGIIILGMDVVFILVLVFLGATTYVAQNYLRQEATVANQKQSVSTTDSSVTIKITPPPPPNPPLPAPTTNNQINNFRYPSSSETTGSNNSLTLKSSDSPDTITDWYKSKIKSSGMNTTSFVVTKTNNNVLNK